MSPMDKLCWLAVAYVHQIYNWVTDKRKTKIFVVDLIKVFNVHILQFLQVSKRLPMRKVCQKEYKLKWSYIFSLQFYYKKLFICGQKIW